MKKWAVLALVTALAIGGGATWALATRGGERQTSTPSLADRIASLGDNPSPESDLVMDRCYNLVPVTDGSGHVTPELAAFPARLLDSEFELTAIRFGDLCYEPTPTKMLETEWKHRKTGVELMIDQYGTSTMPTRIAPLYATFSDAGYDFNIINLRLHGDLSPSGLPLKAIDAATAHRVVELAVHQLRPPVPLSCFYRSVAKDWPDLAGLGIGDPRDAIPNGYSSLNLNFTALERPARDCPPASPPPSAEPEVQLQAMFSGPGSSLLAVFVSSVTPDDIESPATFRPGDARWRNAKYRYSINWAPERVTDEQARAIAKALDPGFGAVCSLSARAVSFAELQQPNLREPVRPGGLPAVTTGSFLIVGGSPGCASGAPRGFQAHWLMEYRDRAGLVDVTALGGEQLPDMRPMVFEGRTLYWKRPDGMAFYVSGIKAEFSRDELLAIARSVDPSFDESLLTTPPPP